MPQEHSIGIIVFNQDKWLIIKYIGGHWGFSKGHKEEGEEPLETARRELFEETGIKAFYIVKDFQEKEEYFFKKEGKTVHKEVIYFLAETPETEAKLSEEHTEYKWLDYQQAMNLLTFKETKELLKKAHDYLVRH
ncbi:NUDIX domain-containing protein [Candidatus Woesearchaeota archaeon]|nr:NUDIX domain-containing protein [Candidatus Woesearchaeota archaeon]